MVSTYGVKKKTKSNLFKLVNVCLIDDILTCFFFMVNIIITFSSILFNWFFLKMSIKALGADHLLLGKVKLFYYFLSESCWEVTYLLTFFSSHAIFNILFKGFKKF